jgi:hypothetical protein
LLTVSAGTPIGIPPLTAACRAVIWPAPRLDDVTHDHVVDLVAADTGLLQGRLDRQSAEVHGLEVLESS